MNRIERGQREYAVLMGAAPEHALAEVKQRSPQLYDAVVEGAFGGSLSHAELPRAVRELATVAMLATEGGAERHLASHTRAALHNGAAASELLALAEHVAVYAGFPRALDALAVIDEVLTEQGIARPAHLQRIRVRDHETVVAQRGDYGPPVVLIHALGLDWRMWDQVMEQLADGRRVYAYDIRGHGWAAGSPTPFTMDDTAEDLIAVLDALGLDRAHVVGLSYGGGIAQTAALAHPGRFASLSLLATTDYPFDSFEARAHSGEVDGMPAQIVPSLTRWFTPAALALNGWGVRYAREMVLHGNPTDWATAWRSFVGLDVQHKLADFPAPTLVLAGELDASTTPDIMRGIADRITGARYQQLPGTPHMQTLEQPDLVAAALAAFVPAVAPEAGR
ncbi:3-oxoadipate enol-lactonase [Nocardia transvalensis]|uniref:3-oxoadipate enol-lactonase n=1 Tax=Nocardia transvalensis TaxID=37333 RepID=A0A7W9P855_9NOCA|nr:alpha/beta fold hydrolase [Nocardia transvalensis]MBB5911256.1 3-oxoadipate enol-lactonase [Nocardia transvalensis]